MLDRDEPDHGHYEVVIIGSGIGGTSAAALLARAGVKVLVVERVDGPGGLAHSFKRGGYTIDPAIHTVFDMDLFDAVLSFLGVRDRVRFLPIDHFYSAVMPGLRADLPVGPEEFIERHVRAFPASERGLRKFYALCERVHEEARTIPPRLSMRELGELAVLKEATFKYGSATAAEVLAEHIEDPLARSLAGAPTMLLGTPPSRMSYITFAQMLFANLTTQPFYCEGGAQEIIDAMIAALERGGGRLVLNTTVEKILIEDGKAVGVELEGGRRVRADVVISNADATHTLRTMVGDEHLPERYLRRLERYRVSLSGANIFLGTTLDLNRSGVGKGFTILYTSTDEREWFQRVLDGNVGASVISVPTIADPTLAPPGEHLVLVLAFAPYEVGNRNGAKEHFLEATLNDLEGLFPGIRDHLTFAECATPRAIERFSGGRNGAAYGWENSPGQTGSKRLSPDTPIDGLFLAGHWTRPGASFLRSTVSGINATRRALAHLGRTDAEQFEFAGLPPG